MSYRYHGFNTPVPSRILMRSLNLSAACRQAELRGVYLELSRLLRRQSPATRKVFGRQSRYYSQTALRRNDGDVEAHIPEELRSYRRHLSQQMPAQWLSFDNLSLADGDPESQPKIQLYGYIGSTRTANKNVKFADLVDPYIRNSCQVTFLKKQMSGGFDKILAEGTPVSVRGFLRERPSKYHNTSEEAIVPMFGTVKRNPRFEFLAEEIVELNKFPEDIIVSSETVLPPELRYLQIKTSQELRHALWTRSLVSGICERVLIENGFDKIETPVLFKSTPEGAREFLVPTRQKGMAYALPQSPQQYKQLLMASGIPKYFQFAKCFRDEDMRADRQPEFTQLDIEMSFADRTAVMTIIEKLITNVWRELKRPAVREPASQDDSDDINYQFQVLQYSTAMSLYGSDKPDLRYTMFPIQPAQKTWLSDEFIRMSTSLEDPAFDFIKLDDRFDVQTLKEFLDSPAAAPYHNNPAGPPAVLTFNPSRPLSGLSALGHEYADIVLEETGAEPGDTFIFQARQNLPFHGGSTSLGDLRRDLIKFGLEKGIIDKAKEDVFAWVVDFPLFKPIDVSEPGQGGNAGIQSTHHPFTAPKTEVDFDYMFTDPLRVTGDHYDLVINGCEVGGGSKRVHDSVVQEYIFREVLKISPERVEDFRHLLEALRAGCPPHAGIALGFDRLLTILLDKESVRDVIAFPKWGASGEDKMVKAPAQINPKQLETYHLSVKE